MCFKSLVKNFIKEFYILDANKQYEWTLKETQHLHNYMCKWD